MLHLTYLIVLLPLVGFAVQLVAGRRLGEPASGGVATAFVGASFVVALLVFGALLGVHAPVRSFTQHLWAWVPVGGLHVEAAFTVDPLSMTMVLFVTGVSTLIHLYSIGYMHGDRDFPKFFLYLNLFVASMLILVLGSNLLVTFVGWEGVGACSYFLISFWFTRESAASAGKKAFVYNRVGDAGFLAAMFLTFDKVGSLTYSTIFARIGSIGSANITAICILLLVGAAGKSAQLPLFPWLADAMEGPTPVSALIHAATMVTAGVYLLCRINPLLHASPAAALTVAIVGAVTALVGATIACAQRDIKKVLAYSTISQLGYMVLAVGTGAYEAAIFLMVAHAFYKGLLFLGAGSVIHGLHDEQDLGRMGNLRRYMKVTFWTVAVGTVALAAIPPLAGFWAKGDVLDAAWSRYPALWAVGIVAAFFTAYYITRLTALAFFGDDRWRELVRPASASGADHGAAGHGGASGDAGHGEAAHAPEPPHEAPWTMQIPLIVLAFCAFFGGALALPFVASPTLLKWVDPVFGSALYNAHQSAALQWGLGITDSLVALIAATVAFRLWSTRSERPALEPVFLFRSWYLNELYDLVIGRPGARLAEFSATVVDTKVIDGAVNGVASLVRLTGQGIRRLQTGYVRNYALGVVLGVVLLLGFMLTRLWWA
ncbi:MAG: NADH-quinone oxidoreductase subunit L [Acidimicrobiales bacterium]